MENIDDEADQLGIGFVKIHDESLSDEYNLGQLPALVYYRHQIPILYEGKAKKFQFVTKQNIYNVFFYSYTKQVNCLKKKMYWNG